MKFDSNKKIILISAIVGIGILFLGFLFRNTPVETSDNGIRMMATVESAYVPLSGKGKDSVFGDNVNLPSLLDKLFIWGIAIAIILAILFIILGAIQYMTTDAVSGKQEGITRIQSALAGLILALASWLILKTINEKLISTEVGINPAQRMETPTDPSLQPTAGADSGVVNTNSPGGSSGTVTGELDPGFTPDTTTPINVTVHGQPIQH